MGLKSNIRLMVTAAGLSGVVGLAIAYTAGQGKPPVPSAVLSTASKTNFLVAIHQPAPPKVVTGRTNYLGEPVTAACASCHATTTPNLALRDAAELRQFHQGMKFNHGELTCLSCHNQSNYDALRLADGATVEFPNVMQLCGQCHGPQARDYRNGAHGGMAGFWDLTRGPRYRNNCTDCHDPHAPAYPVVAPVFKPAPASRGHAAENHGQTQLRH